MPPAKRMTAAEAAVLDAQLQEAAGLAGRLKCKKRLLFPYRINVSAHHADNGARFAWLSPFGKHRGIPVMVSDNLS